jgi:ABC-type polysaccharide/polyol phosphate export permease
VLIFRKKRAIYELAKREFQAQNKNSYLGIIWGYIQPLVYIFSIVLVFSIGLRGSRGGTGVPFAVFFISGMICWQFFSGTFLSLTKVVKSHTFLVKKGDFSLSILHIAKILSTLIPHLAILAVTIIICWFYGYPPTLYNFQLLYYLAAMFFLLLGLGWITSSTSIFIQDVSNITSVLVQFGFWFTPIIWNINKIPEKYRWIVRLNPMCYIVDGYRESLIKDLNRAFWSKPYPTMYFWFFTILVLLIGVIVFRRLKPHFGEVI